MKVQKLLRFSYLILGFLVLFGAVSSSAFHNADTGYVTREICLPLAAGVSIIVLGAGWGTAWRVATRWLALALLGQTVALQLVDAGPLVHYQHLILPVPATMAFYAVVALQAVAVAIGLARRMGAIRAWILQHFHAWQVVLVLGASLLFSATVSRDIKFYFLELLVAATIQAINLANIILFAVAIPSGSLPALRDRLARWFGPLKSGRDAEPGPVDRFAVGAAIWVTVLAAFLSVVVYERHPHVSDEIPYLYHARYFAAGMLTMPLPAASEAFNLDLMDYDATRWFSPVPPGWPGMLTVGVLFGVPWLVNPILAGINILLSYVFVRELYPRRVARIAVILLCVSPWHVFMAMNFMNHTFTMTCLLLAMLGVLRSRRTGSIAWALVAGLATGVGSLIRPLEGLIMMLFLLTWIAGLGGKRLKLTAIAAFFIGTGLTGSLTIPYNKAITGDMTKAPIMAYTDKYYGAQSNALGFGPNRGLGWALDPYPGHTPLESLINDNLNLYQLNVELFGWSIGSLGFLALMLFAGRYQRSDIQMLVLVAVVIGLYSCYWFSGGPDFGARYWYLTLPACILLTVRGIEVLEQKAEGAAPRVLVVVGCLAAMTLVNFFPWRGIDKYHHYLRMRPDVRVLARTHNFGRSLVLIRGERFPDYASAAIYNPLNLHAAAPVYAWDRDPEVRRKVVEAYADRPIWVINGPTVTGKGFEIFAGPKAASDILNPSQTPGSTGGF